MNTKLYQKLISRITITPDGCWEWQGAKLSSGYGLLRVNGKNMLTHRAMMLATYDNIPDKSYVCHHCDNPPCINPEHLFFGTQSQNLQDMIKKGRPALLGNKIRASWTAERRIKNADNARERARQLRVFKAREAGVPEDWKYCPVCKQWKERVGFPKDRAHYDGLDSMCKQCKSKTRKGKWHR